MNPPATGWSLTVPPLLWERLYDHLFPGDDDEHAAVILASLADGPRGHRLLARHVLPATDGTDYVLGSQGYRALTVEFIDSALDLAEKENLAYLAVHCHRGSTRVAFSKVDLASQKRGHPAIAQHLHQPAGGLVLAQHAVAGRVSLPDDEHSEVAETVIPGGNLLRLRSEPSAPPVGVDLGYNRQSRVFGEAGQAVFGQMRVAVVGVGGVGSILVELLARLGIGHLTLIDPDRVDPTNLPRLLAARRLDALPWLRGPTAPGIVRTVAERLAARKTRVAARNARRANPRITVTRLDLDVGDPRAVTALTQVDWIFLAADTAVARHLVNATVQQYLIPATQVGVAVPVQPDGEVGDIHIAVRPVLPGARCLWCEHLIDATDLATETLPDAMRAQARYVADVPAASVMALNAIAAAEAVDHFMLAAAGLHAEDRDYDAITHEPRYRDRVRESPRPRAACRWCSGEHGSALALGDAKPLPAMSATGSRAIPLAK